jgi:hypothetical protein
LRGDPARAADEGRKCLDGVLSLGPRGKIEKKGEKIAPNTSNDLDVGGQIIE